MALIGGYLALSLYYIFTNAKSITAMSGIAATYPVAVAVDVLLIDTMFAFLWSAFF